MNLKLQTAMNKLDQHCLCSSNLKLQTVMNLRQSTPTMQNCTPVLDSCNHIIHY